MRLNKTKFLLIAILLSSFVIRFSGAKPGYNSFHSDEGISYSAAVSMIKNGNLDPLRYDYPAVVPLTNYISFKFFFIPLWWAKYYLTHIPQLFDGLVHFRMSPEEYRRVFQLEILGEREINALFWGRYTTAIVSTGSIFLIYLLGKRLFNTKVGIIAAVLLAVNFRAVLNSHIGLPDTYNAFLLLLSLILSLRIIDKPTKKSYLAAGVGMGLAFATKYQFFSVIPFIIAHIWSISYQKHKSLRSYLLLPMLSGIAVITTFLFINPYLLVHFEEAFDIVTFVSTKYAMGRKQLMTYPLSYYYHVDFGPLLFTVTSLGAIYTIFQYPKRALFLLGFVVPFLYIMLYYSIGGFYIRNFVTVTPLLLLFAATGLERIFVFLTNVLTTKNSKRNLVAPFIFIIGLAIVARTSAINTWIHTKYYNLPWVYTSFPLYADKYIENGMTIAAHPFDPVSPNKQVKRIDFLTDSSYSLSEFREQGADLAAINMDWAGNQSYGWMNTIYPESMTFWQKPVLEMSESYWGISTEEMLKHTLTAAYKPWQAPEAALFLIDVPTFPVGETEEIASFDFEADTNSWKISDPEKNPLALYSFDKEVGKLKNGSIKAGEGGTTFASSRIVSKEFVVQGDHVYTVEAQVLSKSPIAINQRNLFIRIDYYSNEIGNARIYTSVSPRYSGEGWKPIGFQSKAPEKAKTARISIQLAGYAGLPYWVDDIRVMESKNIYEEDKQYLNISKEDYQDLLYPYSHGNL